MSWKNSPSSPLLFSIKYHSRLNRQHAFIFSISCVNSRDNPLLKHANTVKPIWERIRNEIYKNKEYL